MPCSARLHASKAYALVLISGSFALRSVGLDPATITTTGTAFERDRGVAIVPFSESPSRAKENGSSATPGGGSSSTGGPAPCGSCPQSAVAGANSRPATRRDLRVTHLRSTLAMATSGAEPVQKMLDGFLEYGGIELVQDGRPVSLGGHELRFAQDRQVPRDGRPCRREVGGDIA